MPPAFVDLFAGAGGMSLGLQWAGLEHAYAAEWDRDAVDTYRENLGGNIRCVDVTALSTEQIYRDSGRSPGEIQVVVGGPPCQGFSIQRRGEGDDPRNAMVPLFARIAADLDPDVIVMENVPALRGRRGTAQLTAARAILQDRYDSALEVLDAADFGVPQRRRRAFLVAWRRGRVRSFHFPAPTHASAVSVRESLGGLPTPRRDGGPDPRFHNHLRVGISALNELRISHVPAGGGRLDIPEELQLPCHRNAGAHRHLDVFGRMEWDKPAPTITAVFDNFSRGRFAHPVDDRVITGREGARLQSFPDSFRFLGTKKRVARQIGNAVPPLLAQAIGRSVLEALNDRGPL